MNEAFLLEHYPDIPWYEPVLIQHASGKTFYGCRICIALEGIRGSAMDDVPATPDEWIEHMAVVHGA